MKKVLIYSGAGVSPECLKNTYHLFKKFSDDVRYAFPWNVIDENWENSTDIFVIPGGEDEDYHKDLGKIGCQKIREFVSAGGTYIGICAGAYFGARCVEFAKGTSMEVIGDRNLAFFNGTAVGPILKPYSYDDNSGACAAKIALQNSQEIYIYYNGGCAFTPEPTDENIEVIGRYSEKENLPAILKCKFGKGQAILSGVHFEQQDSNNRQIQEKLNLTNCALMDLVDKLLS